MITDEVKEILLERLDFILQNLSLISYVDEIANIRKMLKDSITSEENLIITNRIKAKFQREANEAIDRNGGSGLVVAGTGSGKSKIAVDRVDKIYRGYYSTRLDMLGHPPKILLVVPTERLRDEGWKEELNKWYSDAKYSDFVTRVCYASLDNIRDNRWDLVILDRHLFSLNLFN